MSSDWQKYRLGDVTRWASGGTPSKQNPEYWGGSIAWISASSMKAKICPIGVATKRVAFNQDVKAITTCSGDLSGDYFYYLLKGSEEFLLNSVNVSCFFAVFT